MHAKHAGTQATLRVATTQHHPTTNPILTNPHTYKGHMMKTRKGEGSGSKKATMASKAGRQRTKTKLEHNKTPATIP